MDIIVFLKLLMAFNGGFPSDGKMGLTLRCNELNFMSNYDLKVTLVEPDGTYSFVSRNEKPNCKELRLLLPFTKDPKETK